MARPPQEFLEKFQKALAKYSAEWIVKQAMNDLLSGLPSEAQKEAYAKYAIEIIEKSKTRKYKDWLITEDEFKI